MKKFVCMLLTAMLLLTTVAFAEEGDLLARIQEKGKIVVATEGMWRPWTYHDENDELVGFDVEIAKAIAEKLGVEVEFVEGEFTSLLGGLDSGRYDIVANGVDVTEERAEKYDFSTPYCYMRTALVVRDDNTDITCFEDLEGKTTSNSIGSTYMSMAESYGAECLGVDTLDQTINMVVNGRADATLNAELSIYDYLSVHPDEKIKIVDRTEEAINVAIPVRKGDDSASLLAAINQAIDELRADGTLTELSIKYFGSDIS